MPEPSVAEMYAEAQRLSTLIDEGVEALGRIATAYANAEAAYRKGKAAAWLRAPEGMLAKEKEAWVDAETAQLRAERDVAEAMKQGGLEALRSRRGQLSAIQTFANAHREEAAFARTGPVAA